MRFRKLLILLVLLLPLSANALVSVVPQGGTGWGAFQFGSLIYGNGQNPLATTTAGVAGQVLALLSGIPTWTGTTTFSSPLLFSSGNVTCQIATTLLSGCLSATDWNTFNNKQPAGSYLTAAPVATSSSETAGNLAYWTSTSGTPATLGKVATGTVSSSGPITVTGSQAVIGSGLTIGCATCLTGNQTITLSGDVTGSGATSITTAFALNVAHAWTALQQFVSASSTSFSALDALQVGRTSTTTVKGDNATSTFAGGVASTGAGGVSSTNGLTITGGNIKSTSGATSTFAGGIDLSAGCVSINTVCIGGSTGVTSLSQTFGTPQTGALTLATTSVAFNGLTVADKITNSGGIFTITPLWSGTLDNTGLTNSTISGIALGGTLNALTATDNTVTFSGSYNGNLARTVGVNLANANTWTGLQIFNKNASSTAESVLDGLFVGRTTATTTIVGDNATSTFAGGITSINAGGLSSSNGLTISGGNLISLGSSFAQFAGGIAIGTSTPWGMLSIGDGFGDTTPTFVVASSSTGLATTTEFIVSRFGNIGIATNTPAALLSVSATSSNRFPLVLVASSSGAYGTSGFATSTAFIIDANGNVGIGTTTPTLLGSFAGSSLAIGGSLYVNGSTTVPELVLSGVGLRDMGSTTPKKNALYKENVPKAWAVYDSTPVTPVIADSFNVSGFVDVGAGVIDLTLGVPFSSIHHVTIASCGDTTIFCSTRLRQGVSEVSTAMTGISEVLTSGANADANNISVVGFGDQ